MIALLLVTLAWTVPSRTAPPSSGVTYVPKECRVYRHRRASGEV